MKKPKKQAAKMRDMKPRKDAKGGGGFGNKDPQGGGSSTSGGGSSLDPNKHPVQ
jgi:hypothetical protein